MYTHQNKNSKSNFDSMMFLFHPFLKWWERILEQGFLSSHVTHYSRQNLGESRGEIDIFLTCSFFGKTDPLCLFKA